MTSGLQRQVIKQPNGTERVSYRDSDGKFISKSTYEKLLGQASESLGSQIATPADHPTNQVEPEESSTKNVAPALGDLVAFIKEERLLIHDFIQLNVEMLRSRIQNGATPNAVPSTAGSSTSSENPSTRVTDNQLGDMNGSANTANASSDVTDRDRTSSTLNTSHVNAPLDPDKEFEKNFLENIRGSDSYVRDKVEKIADAARLAGKRPTFVNAKLAHRPLRGLNLEASDFCGADLTNTDLSGTILTQADLSGKNTNLTNATMKGTKCEAANFDEATLDGIQLHNVDLSKATLRNTRLRGAQLNNVNLERADLSGADLSGATFKKVCLRETNLDGVTIDNAITFDPDCQPILEVACWENPDPATVKGSFKDAILRGANFSCLDLSGSDFSRANLDRARLHDTCLQNATFEEANLEGANLQRAQLKNAHLNNAYLGNAKLRHANLSNADLTNANLTNADLILADLTNADLSRANLRNALVSPAQLDSAKSLADAIMRDGSIHP